MRSRGETAFLMKQNRVLDGIRILTTDAEKRIGLYAIRYLGRAGAHISGIAEYNAGVAPIGFLSRYARNKISFKQTNFHVQVKQFLKANAGNFDVINPIDIAQMLCVMDADFEQGLGCTYLLPKRESLVIADNKELLTRHALNMGLPCPQTFFQVAPNAVVDLCREGLTFPCIIKFRGDNRETHWRPEERYSIVRTPVQLESEYRRMHAIEPFPIIQEYIQGTGYGFFALYDRNRRLKAQFCHKRIREYPLSGGPSSCCESIYDPAIMQIGRQLLESLDWTGLAMVELKFDEKRNQYFIIEVNPRYWGSLPLAVWSGVNFPVLHMLSALGINYEPVTTYRSGLKLRFFDRDIKAIIARVRQTKNIRQKVNLVLEIFNPRLKDGLVVFDDLGPVLERMIRLVWPRAIQDHPE